MPCAPHLATRRAGRPRAVGKPIVAPGLPGLALAALVFQACSLSGGAEPRLHAVEPARGFVSNATRVVIRGQGFLVRPIQSATGGEPAVDATYRAWLGPVELEEVVWVDVESLHGTIPAGLPPGTHSLAVEGPFGLQGRLESAFTVLDVPPGSLSVTVAATPSSVSVGQPVTVTARVANGGTGTVAGVVPGGLSVDGSPATPLTGPEPPSAPSLSPGEAATFHWTLAPPVAGPLSVDASATGTDQLSGTTVSAASTTSALVMVQRPAALQASLVAPRSVALGTSFEVTMAVENSGEAPAVAVVPTALAPNPASTVLTLESGPVPASASVAGGTSATFTWWYRASDVPGTFRLSGGAVGEDANDGTRLSSPTATSEDVAVGRAALMADLIATPAAVPPGGAITLTLQLTNPGTAPVVGVVPGSPAVDGTGTVDPGVAGPAPASIPSLGAGDSASFVWTYTARGVGSLGFAAAATGTDGFSGGTLLASARVHSGVTVTGNTLGVTGFSASPAIGTVDAPVTLALDLTNPGTSSVSVTSIVPSASPSATATCTSPAVPVAIAGGGTARFTWACTAGIAATYAFGASVTGVPSDGGPTAVIPVPPITVAVMARPALAIASFTSSRETANVGQAVGLTLRLSNPGSTPATVTAVQPSASPTGATCTAVAPAPPLSLASGAAVTFTWSCTSAAAGSHLLGGSVAAVDQASGANLGTVLPPLSLAVQTPATLAVSSFTVSPTTVAAGTPATVTLVLRNDGGASAIVGTIQASISPSNRGSCTAASPSPPRTVAGGTSGTFTWTCTAASRRAYTLGASVTATDANTGATLSPRVPSLTLTVP